MIPTPEFRALGEIAVAIISQGPTAYPGLNFLCWGGKCSSGGGGAIAP